MYFTKRVEPDFFDTFNLESFMSIQKKICMRYEEDKNSILLTNISVVDFISKYDKYILQAIEEVIEADIEIRNDNPSRIKFIEEVIDVMMYVGSANSIIQTNLEHLTKEWKHKENWKASTEIKLKSQYDPRNIYDDSKFLLELINLMVKQRMQFPERKWHKPHPPLKKPALIDRLCSVYELNLQIFETILLYLMRISNSTDISINTMIMNKQEKVINL